MNKGFTLIELLAVIVILAIIAIIATPIILNIIEDTKEQSAKSSADLYVDGLAKQIVSKNMTSAFNPSSCTVSNGNVTCDGQTLEYNVDGKKPTSGTISFTNGVISGYSLCINEYRVVKTGDTITTIKDSTCSGAEPVYAEPGLYRDGVMVYTWTELIDEGLIEVYEDVYDTEEGEEHYNCVSATAPLNGYLYIDESIDVISGEAFADCGITGVTIPNGVIEIHSAAFAENQIKSIHIPESVNYIAYSTFTYNPLISITVDSNNQYFYCDDCNAIIDIESDAITQGSKNTIIPSGIVSISDYAFANVPITSITIPSSVANIGQGAFMDSGLTSVTIPNGISQIQSETFANAPLTSITIPSSVTNIWPGALENNQLTSATFATTSGWRLESCSNSNGDISQETMANPQAIAALMRENDTCGLASGK